MWLCKCETSVGSLLNLHTQVVVQSALVSNVLLVLASKVISQGGDHGLNVFGIWSSEDTTFVDICIEQEDRLSMVVNAVVHCGLDVAALEESLVDVLIPYLSGLSRTINVLDEFEGMCLPAPFVLETTWNFHIHLAFGIGLRVCQDKINLSRVKIVKDRQYEMQTN